MSFSNKSVAFHTLGCKLNFSETSTIARMFEQKGFVKKKITESADVYVINTCSVTENADKECKTIVKNALSQNPEAFVAIIGCYAQLKPDEISKIKGVDLILGASEKFKLLNYLHLFQKNTHAQIHNCEISNADFFVDSYSLNDRTRSFLKIQDGCDYSCTFCTIPLARGKSRSDLIENVVLNAKKIAGNGIKEIVLTGVNIGDFINYNQPNLAIKPTKKETFLDLIYQLDQIHQIERFRISSIEPNLLTDNIIDFVSKSARFVPHFHIPLQSGSNQILKKMKRRYQTNLFLNRIHKIKSAMPNCCIGIDVIVGFPGETEIQFLETYNFINSLDVSYLHVFTYSERPNTEALNIADSVPMLIRKQRNKMLRILSVKKIRAFYQSQIQKKLTVIFENENKNGFMYGYTQNYVRVKLPYINNLCNLTLNVVILNFDDDGCMNCALC